MSFIERYVHSVCASDLRDDDRHHATEPLHASATADIGGSGVLLGSLLSRVKYGTGSKACAIRSAHLRADIDRALQACRAAGVTEERLAARIAEVNKIYGEAEIGLDSSLAELLRLWTELVTEKGRSRGWIKVKFEWDIAAAAAVYRKIAHLSLAHWIDGNCETCKGAKVDADRRTCKSCGGTGRAEVSAGRHEANLVLDMVSELEGIFQAYSARAASKLRRVG